MAETTTAPSFLSKIDPKTARKVGLPMGGIAAALALKGEKNTNTRRAALAAGSSEMAWDTFKDAKGFWKEGEYADFMMEALNLFLTGMGVAEGDAEPIIAAGTMRLMKGYAHGKADELNDRFTAAKKERAKRIAGLPMIAHIHQKTSGHSHDHDDDEHDHGHDHGATYKDTEVIDEATKLCLTRAEQEHMEGLLDHWRQFGASRVKEAFEAYEKLTANKNRTAYDIAAFEHQYGFIVFDGLKFDFHSQPFPQDGKPAKDPLPVKSADDAKTAGTELPKWKFIADDYNKFHERFSCLYYDVKKTNESNFSERFVREIEVGDIVKVNPNQGIPVDGVLTEVGGDKAAHTELDTSLYTGDHSRKTITGDPIFQMARNGGDELLMTASKKYKESSGFMLVHGDTKQHDTRAARETWLDKTLKTYVKWISAVGGLLFFKDAVMEGEKGKLLDTKKLISKENLRKSMEFFIVAAPCQIAISMMALPAVVERLKDEGKTYVLKSDHLVNMQKTNVAVFDLVGTLTEGKPSVEEFAVAHGDKNGLLALARSLEVGQTHTIAHAIRTYATDELKDAKTPAPEITWVNEKHHYITQDGAELTRGIYGKVGNAKTHIGNIDYFTALVAESKESGVTAKDLAAIKAELNKIHTNDEPAFKDAIIVFKEGTKNKAADFGIISLQDKPRAAAIDTLKALKKSGKEIVIATGSNKEKAEAILQNMGIDKMVTLHAGLDIGENTKDVLERRHTAKNMTTKTDIVYHYIKQNKKVAMVGDGFNDGAAMDLVSEHEGCALGMQSESSGLIQDKAGIMIRDIDDVYRINHLSTDLNKSMNRSVNFSMGWTGLLIVAHLSEKKIKQWFGFELSTLTKGILHEGPTAGMAVHTWNESKRLAAQYVKDTVPEPGASR
jgi:cation transport ATPase